MTEPKTTTNKFDAHGFISRISKKGLASPNKFKVRISFPTGNLSHSLTSLNGNNDMNLMVESVDIAGRNVQSTINIEYGIRREVAYNAPAYDPLNITFLCSQDMYEKRALEKWNHSIVNTTFGSDVGYYDDYIGSVEVCVLSKDLKRKEYKVTYREAYPKTINAINMNHATTNSTLKVTASFVYAFYETSDSNISGAEKINFYRRKNASGLSDWKKKYE